MLPMMHKWYATNDAQAHHKASIHSTLQHLSAFTTLGLLHSWPTAFRATCFRVETCCQEYV